MEQTWEVGIMMGFEFDGEKNDVLKTIMVAKERDQEVMTKEEDVGTST